MAWETGRKTEYQSQPMHGKIGSVASTIPPPTTRILIVGEYISTATVTTVATPMRIMNSTKRTPSGGIGEEGPCWRGPRRVSWWAGRRRRPAPPVRLLTVDRFVKPRIAQDLSPLMVISATCSEMQNPSSLHGRDVETGLGLKPRNGHWELAPI